MKGTVHVEVRRWPNADTGPHYELRLEGEEFYLSKEQLATVADALLEYRSRPERMVLEVTPGHNNPG